MDELTILGSAYAVPGEAQDNTHLILRQGKRSILIDTASNPIQSLSRAGVPLEEINEVILTHFHPDHVSGMPLFLMSIWLLGRKEPLDVYGLAYTLERMRAMLDLYELQKWPNFFPINFHVVPEEEDSLLFDSPDLRVTASPVRHLIPTIGLRMEFPVQKRVVAYSCDTEPCDEVVRLAKDADILLHEATAASIGHTSAAQAGEIAKRAGVKSLYLIHYSLKNNSPQQLTDAARQTFGGPVYLTRDMMSIGI